MKHIVFILLSILFVACHSPEKDNQLFRLKPTEITGIAFENKIIETEELNYFTYPYLYMGGGTAIGDFNNDGLEDIFFTGNQVSNKLYLNKGGLHFEDVSKKAGVAGDNRWYTGVSLVDINSDGWLDIYLSVAGLDGPRENELYINNGDLTFTEAAEDYGIADGSYSYQGTFFDYDIDGDLDLLVINYSPTQFKSPPEYYRHKMDNINDFDSDHFYENIDGKFIDKTKESGLSNFGLTISSSITDFNNDGFQDIYLCNDFGSPDYLYLNNGDKTFREVSAQATNHTAMYSMGSDIVDLDGDGLMDFLQLDMNPQDNYRSKANMASMNIPLFWAQVDNGLHYQYMHNVMQLNSGIVDGIPRFSDISQMTGISSTDWSWSILALDVDNDAKKDIFVTNGTRRDINNRDFFNNLNRGLAFTTPKRVLEESQKIPSQAIPNYLYKNKGDLSFEDISSSSGIGQPSFSNGMSYGDLDNDGDLDVVINNIDQTAFIYENTASDNENNNYVKIKLQGGPTNPSAIGSRIKIFTKNGMQTVDQMPVRGFQSTVSNILHFGLGKDKTIDSLQIVWPDGEITNQTNVQANQTLILNKESATTKPNAALANSVPKLFQQVEEPLQVLDFSHKENDFDDFSVQVLLPHKMSQFGPAMTIADFNGDGQDDVFLGGSSGELAALFLQNGQGSFEKQESELFETYKMSEDIDALSIDFDRDGDLDLYIVSGGNEFEPGHSNYNDRLYINNGEGGFSDGSDKLPKSPRSGSVVTSFDYDGDGDLDLFVGTRMLPHNYPFSEGSFIYENRNGRFEDVTQDIAPELMNAAMVTDAAWADINSDGRADLMLVGEWMEPWVLLQGDNGTFERADNQDLGLSEMTGWWFSIEQADLDGDGDTDFVLGNLGENYKYQATEENPFKIFAKDFNASGSTDIVLSYPQDGNYYPVRGKQCSSEQIPELKKKFKDYNSFAQADINTIYSDMGLSDALEMKASTFSSMVLRNDNGHFSKIKLPSYAQISSINDILIDDFDGNGSQDLVLAGNLYTSEIETTRNDASYGCFITFDGGLENMTAIKPSTSGLFIRGDAKKVGKINIGGQHCLIVAINDGPISIHHYK
ncbi:VCBS repeat-containing protein [Muricauda sp. CAU 1633]|uniref:VCBS repeat-containing protein n=1 Tax=Allomuricauda sp. CAU 1633 TaxID=2816036 RepID=UPI001A8DA875|nr:VCBS repeat-containing protein [Muricauda sp. CAU 1633]MBO0323633.1 VCBS repeat-containing protein [Muricauda sp. CAU 1633]